MHHIAPNKEQLVDHKVFKILILNAHHFSQSLTFSARLTLNCNI